MEKEEDKKAMQKEEDVELSKLPDLLTAVNWALLPDLALHSITMRLKSPAYFTTLCGVCHSWRSTISSPRIIADFISSLPPLILLFPHDTSSAVASLYSLADDGIYNIPSIPSFETLNFFGISNGCLLGLDDSFNIFPSIADPLSGFRIDFDNHIISPMFHFAILTARPTSPEARLIFTDGLLISTFPIGGPIGGRRRTLHGSYKHLDAIFFQGRLYITHLDGDHVLVVEYNLQTDTEVLIFSGKKGLLVESSEGELLMVLEEEEMLVGYKLLPRTENALVYNEETDWPKGGERILFIGWQRSDLIISSFTGNIRKKFRIESTSPFWSSFWTMPQLHSNGFYVSVDARGRAPMSKIQPSWISFQQFIDRIYSFF